MIDEHEMAGYDDYCLDAGSNFSQVSFARCFFMAAKGREIKNMA